MGPGGSHWRLLASGFEAVDLREEAVVGLEGCMPGKAIWFGMVIAIASAVPGIAVMVAADVAGVVDIAAEMMAGAVMLPVGMKGPTAPGPLSGEFGWLVADHLSDHRVESAALEKLQSRTQTGH